MSSWRTYAVLTIVVLLTGGNPSAQNPVLKTVMRDKLTNARLLVGAVVGGDFAAISRSAQALGRVSETEIATWQVGATPEYREQGISFLMSVQELRDAAARRDSEAALQAYGHLVASCTRCHALVRRSGVALLANSGRAPDS